MTYILRSGSLEPARAVGENCLSGGTTMYVPPLRTQYYVLTPWLHTEAAEVEDAGPHDDLLQDDGERVDVALLRPAKRRVLALPEQLRGRPQLAWGEGISFIVHCTM